MNRYSRVHAEIDLDAILHNMDAMRGNIAKDTKIMAVIKADGYGHGAVEIAETIEKLDYLYGYAVATVEEGLILRNHGIQKPILILGYVFPDQYVDMIKAGIRPTVFTREMAEKLSVAAASIGRDCKIHFAIDTGMSRIGYQVTEEAADEMAQLSKLPHIIVEGIFTHFATADEADKSRTNVQYEKFSSFIDRVEKELSLKIPLRHCSNSASILELPDMHMDAVRAGIILYGMWPSDEVKRDGIVLEPLLSLKSRIAYIKELDAGQEISYGGTFRTAHPMRVATIPVGYADGYPRGLSNKGDVLIAGKRARILGRVCMDQFMVDVTKIPEAKVGDVATLIGTDGIETITMEEIGDRSGRFNYETACCLGKRIPRVYEKDGKIVCTRDYFHEEKLFF